MEQHTHFPLLSLSVEIDSKASFDDVIRAVRRALIENAFWAEAWDQTHDAKSLGPGGAARTSRR